MNLILDPQVILGILIGLAILTPVGAVGAYRLRPDLFPRRLVVLGGALGPFALIYWGFHNMVLKALGFDSIYSALIVFLVAAVIGYAAGDWAGRENKRES